MQVSNNLLAVASDENLSNIIQSSVDSADVLKAQRPAFILKFHYTRRMADILREEAEREQRI